MVDIPERTESHGPVFIYGVEGEQTIMHLSNSLPDIRIAVHKNALEEQLLVLGRLLTLNMVKTKEGWM